VRVTRYGSGTEGSYAGAGGRLLTGFLAHLDGLRGLEGFGGCARFLGIVSGRSCLRVSGVEVVERKVDTEHEEILGRKLLIVEIRGGPRGRRKRSGSWEAIVRLAMGLPS
jgi:hypothetical protein